jgi:hypothetical protein
VKLNNIFETQMYTHIHAHMHSYLHTCLAVDLGNFTREAEGENASAKYRLCGVIVHAGTAQVCMFLCTHVCMYVCMYVGEKASAKYRLCGVIVHAGTAQVCMFLCTHVCMYVCMYVCGGESICQVQAMWCDCACRYGTGMYACM